MEKEKLIKELSRKISITSLDFLSNINDKSDINNVSYVMDLISSSSLSSMFHIMELICESSDNKLNMERFIVFRDSIIKAISEVEFITTIKY